MGRFSWRVSEWRFDKEKEIANRNMGAKNRSNILPSIFLADLWKVYGKFVMLILTISTLLFLVVRKASREHKLKLIISPRSLHNFWNFPWYANHCCTGHAAMSTERGNDRLITACALSCYRSPHWPLSQKFLRIPQRYFASITKKINPHNLQLSTSHCGSIVQKINQSCSSAW